MGAWIETGTEQDLTKTEKRRSLMGAWIETITYPPCSFILSVAPLWERGLKQKIEGTFDHEKESLPYGSVD